MSYQRIYFDLDGTLTDSGPGIMNGVTYALKKMGYPIPPREVMGRYIGPPLADSFCQFDAMEEAEAHRAVDVFREYYNVTGKFENMPYPGIAEMLQALKNQGKILMVATSKPETTANEVLEHFNLAQYFDLVVGSILDGGRVTKIEVLEHALALGGKENAVMVGDRCFDVEGARYHGLDCVGVLFGYGDREELTKAGAIALAEDTQQLLKILEA